MKELRPRIMPLFTEWKKLDLLSRNVILDVAEKRPVSIIKENLKCDFLKMAKSGNEFTPNNPLRLKIY